MSQTLRYFLIVSIVILTGAAAHAQIVVTSLDDNGDTGGAGDCELREALINANSDNQSGSTDCAAGSGVDTLDLTGLSGVIELTNALPVTSSEIVVLGPGADQLSIDANRSGHIFLITNVLTLNDVTLTGAQNSQGGGVVNFGTTRLNRSKVIDNFASNGAGIYNNGTLEITDSEISNNGKGPFAAGSGGGVYSIGGQVEITRSTISNNSLATGGGVYTSGSVFVKILNSTVSGNTASSLGGGIALTSGDSLVVWNSTITDNFAAIQGGGILSTGILNLGSTVVAKNSAGSSAPDIFGTVTYTLFNFIGNNENTSGVTNGVSGDQVGTSGSPIDPLLFPLANYGGMTPTHLPKSGSQLLDKGSCGFVFIVTDQRGTLRTQDLPDDTYPNATDTCDIGAVEVEADELTEGLQVTAGIFLEGPYAGSDLMSLALNSDIPTSQPYADAHFDGTANEYDGTESVSSVPADVVDWVLVSLRTGTAANTEVIESPAFVKDDGTIVGLDGGTLVLPTLDGNYYLVVRHRNHLGVMSTSAVDATSSVLDWEFRNNLANAFTAGGTAMKSLGDGNYGLFASDGNVDGQTTAPDFNIWNAATTAGVTGYVPSDYNMDGIVTAPDFNLWNANTTAGASSQVPD